MSQLLLSSLFIFLYLNTAVNVILVKRGSASWAFLRNINYVKGYAACSIHILKIGLYTQDALYRQ